MRSRMAAFEEYLTYTLLLWVLLNFVVFRLLFGRSVLLESAIALAVAGVLGYAVYDYSASRLPGRPDDGD